MKIIKYIDKYLNETAADDSKFDSISQRARQM